MTKLCRAILLIALAVSPRCTSPQSDDTSHPAPSDDKERGGTI
jgi:hypothetical protein